MNHTHVFATSLQNALPSTISLELEQIQPLIEKPKHAHVGDLAFPCFTLAKILKKSPQNIAEEIVQNIQDPLFESVVATGGYVNVFLNQSHVAKSVLSEVIIKKEQYGSTDAGNGEVVTLDYSSPNIAKPFSMGHLRSTVIGNSLALLAEKQGYQTVRINHLGDWGTQFGKMMAAYKLWGNDDLIKKNPLKELVKLYIQFHAREKTDPTLTTQGREWFKKLEDGEQEAVKLHAWFKELSLNEFMKVYELLGISFDSYNGEAFYNDKMDDVIQSLQAKNLLIPSQGARVVSLTQEGMPPCLIQKNDGTTLYATRDLAAAIYRQKTYGFKKSIYVVGNEQSLHFKQLFAVLDKMGYKWQNNMTHVPFGLMLKDGKKMSTRQGKIVLLEDVIEEAKNLALQEIVAKNPSLPNKEQVAHDVAIGAIFFHDLKTHRLQDVEFNMEHMLKFEGTTGPYIQYTHARATSLLKKGMFESQKNIAIPNDPEAWSVITALQAFPQALKEAFEDYDPSKVAKSLLDLARAFNHYYGTVRILADEEQKQARLNLVYAVTVVLKEGLRVLGIQAPDEM